MSETIKTYNPTTGEQLDHYQLISAEDAEQAVTRSHEAYLNWKKTSFGARAEIFNNLADLMEERIDDLANLMTLEMGKVAEQGKQEVQLCAEICRYTAEHGASFLEDEARVYEGGKAIITYQPTGVILGIQPWNFPLYQVIRYSASNIMAGNTTVLKHAQNVFGMAQAIQQLYEDAGFPKNVYQSLMIDGSTASGLIKHKHVRGVTFTGSDSVGKQVAKEAAGESKKTVMELGSNDAFIVLADADIDNAVEMCIKGRVINNGETCVAAKRFVISDSVYDEFRDKFVAQCKKLTVGDPSKEGTDLGPMAREDLRDELHDQVKESVNAGATISLGGEVPDGAGYFYPVTVLENVSPGMPAYDDELFGPVASLIRARDDKQAMEIANDSRYGLGGGIFSTDTDNAIALAKNEFDTGMVNINGYSLAQPNLPFGGVKDSGYGREHGGYGIREFVNIKTIMVASN
ncbi:NAD-dependent succinate-semialdehyde dehydrogenase [Alteromonas sp.]|uniref:NAD-dependent succinate-semialdehyde dehydrogenase n=1 Tax=Alteromonas sp. TaxID=232 RepID=UPI000B74C241|nr:NAD-dependent succinate-semialdehyde dehydrogenase [Alteromonas sp.]MAI36223.1 succinate-semialdehyde dehydrogenase [Alteromonas sp.]OUX91807.1 MAG: succinate-semialdehyde dehydrogenase [Alteromonas sp. TMED35]|tara:strand:- start:4855 stop:6234 length:1380 start_codon:yes stop_codon:yes gene_type:complete